MQIKTPYGPLDIDPGRLYNSFSYDVHTDLNSTLVRADITILLDKVLKADLERYVREWCKHNPEGGLGDAVASWHPGRKAKKPPPLVSTALRKQLEKLSPEIRAKLLAEIGGTPE